MVAPRSFLLIACMGTRELESLFAVPYFGEDKRVGVKHSAFVTTAQKGFSAEQIFSFMRPTEGVEHLLEVSYGQRLRKSAEFWNLCYLEITSFLIVAGDNGIVQNISVLRGRNAVLYHDRISFVWEPTCSTVAPYMVLFCGAAGTRSKSAED